MYWTIFALLALAPPAPAAEPDTKAVAAANNRFAVDLYGRLAGKEGNLFFSPYSVSTALAMTSAGARGDTLKQMASTLHLPRYQLSVANSLWGQKGYPFLPEFRRLQREQYGAPLHEVDFADAARAAKAINSWVEEHTRNKIKDLVSPDMLGEDTRLVLTNAIYFKGDWAAKFKKGDTREGPFHVSAAKQVKAPLMSLEARSGPFKYH
jgi:serpin B